MEENNMEPRLEQEPPPQPETLSPSNSLRRRNNDMSSPEFEFCSFPQQPYLPSADELFVDGVLLPLDLVSLHDPEPNKPNLIEKFKEPEPEPDPDPELSQPGPGPQSAAAAASSASKRWKDIFKMGEKKGAIPEVVKEKSKGKEKKKDRKGIATVNGTTGGVSSGTELNINIWPFSRSWSAGTGRNASKTGSGSVSRKVSSAPCSRSNSAGETKSRKWPNSPSRGGIHLGRHSPVWQVKRAGSGLKNTEQARPQPPVRNVEKGEVRRSKSDLASKTRSINLNVPMCIGYRQQLSCRRDENVLLGGDVGGGDNIGSGGAGSSLGGNKLFYLRTLFTKKVY